MTVHLSGNVPLARLPDGTTAGVRLNGDIGLACDDAAAQANVVRDQTTDLFLESFVKRGPVDRLLEQPGQLDRFLAPE